MKVAGHRDTYIGNTVGLNKTIGVVLRGLQPLIGTLPTPPSHSEDFDYVTQPPFKCLLAETTASHNCPWEAEPSKDSGDKVAHRLAQFLAGKPNGKQHDQLYKVLRQGLPLAMYKTTRKASVVLVVVPSARVMFSIFFLLFS